MKVQWFWNRTYEGLMGSVGDFLAKNGSINVINVQMHVSPDQSMFYWSMIYR